jgi:SPP1 family predicted phage head-tail adaptor
MPGFTINPGDMRTEITLLTPMIVTDAGKAQRVLYANFATNANVWAKIVFAHGQESVVSDALKNVQRLTLTIRYRSDVNATHAMRMNNEVWKFIGTPDNIQKRNRWLEIQAELVKGTV